MMQTSGARNSKPRRAATWRMTPEPLYEYSESFITISVAVFPSSC